VSIVLANHYIVQNLYPSSARRKEIDLLCKGFTIGFLAFCFFPLSIPRRRNKEISFLLFSINTRSTTSNRNPSPQLQHFGLLFSENVVVLESGYWNFLQKCKRLGLSFIFFVDPNSFEKGVLIRVVTTVVYKLKGREEWKEQQVQTATTGI
jgi:hypothetical protein